MANYNSEHGDIFIIADAARKQLAYNAYGINYSVQPSTWYMVNSAQTIYKGYAIAILTIDPITVGIADQSSVAAIIGVALNTITGPSYVISNNTGTSIDSSNPYMIHITSTTNIVAGMMVAGVGIPTNTIVSSVSANSYIILNNQPTGFSNLTFGVGIEVASEGQYNFTTAVFNASDVGLPLYMYPAASTTFTGPGTISPPNTQLTTSHSLAAASGNPIIEVGVCTSIYSMLISLQGDVRGASGLSQVSLNAGEAIPNTATPLVVSMGSDGYAYVADKRKSYNIVSPKLLLGTNSSGLTAQIATPQTTMATFTVLTGASSGGTLAWGGGASGSVTVSTSDNPSTVALDIIASAPAGWVITSQGPNVTMVKTGVIAAPTLATGNGVTFSAISTTFTYSQYTLTLSGTANGGSIVIHGLSITPTTGHTSNQAASDIVTAINLSTNGLSTTWLASSSTNVVTLTSIVNTNRNTPVGFLIGANSGFSNTYASGTGSAGGSIAKILWIPDLGYFVGLVSGSSNAAYYSIDGINWAATGQIGRASCRERVSSPV